MKFISSSYVHVSLCVSIADSLTRVQGSEVHVLYMYMYMYHIAVIFEGYKLAKWKFPQRLHLRNRCARYVGVFFVSILGKLILWIAEISKYVKYTPLKNHPLYGTMCLWVLHSWPWLTPGKLGECPPELRWGQLWSCHPPENLHQYIMYSTWTMSVGVNLWCQRMLYPKIQPLCVCECECVSVCVCVSLRRWSLLMLRVSMVSGSIRTECRWVGVAESLADDREVASSGATLALWTQIHVVWLWQSKWLM